MSWNLFTFASSQLILGITFGVFAISFGVFAISFGVFAITFGVFATEDSFPWHKDRIQRVSYKLLVYELHAQQAT